MQAPDPSAWMAALFDEHSAALLRWFQARSLSREVAADLLAETFAVAIEQQARYEPGLGTERAWLWGIGKNLFRQYLRLEDVDRRARARVALRTPTVSDHEHVDADARMDAARLVTDLSAELDLLSEAVAVAVRLRVLEDEPYEVVAERCGCSIGAARVRVSRGLAALWDRLADSDREVTP